MQGILYLIDNYRDPYAGTEGQIYHLIQGLDRKRFKPKLILFQPSPYIDREGFPCEVEVLHIQKLLSPCSWIRLWRLASDAHSEGYKLAHIFFNDPSIAAPAFLKSHGIKVLVSRRDMGFWHNRANLTILRLNRYFVDGVIANSNAVKKITHERERFSLNDIHVIPNGYPAATVSPADSCPPELTDLIQRRDCIVGLVANIRPIKRIQDAIDAVAILRRRNCPVSLVVIGGGESSALEHRAEKRSVRAYIRFLGSRRDVDRFLPYFSIGVLCSESEGFSNAIIEYLRAGIPTICTSVGGNVEIIRDDTNGYLYPVGDVQRLAQLLQGVAECCRRRTRLSQGALASARHYTVERMVNAHEDLYIRLLNGCIQEPSAENAATTTKYRRWSTKRDH